MQLPVVPKRMVLIFAPGIRHELFLGRAASPFQKGCENAPGQRRRGEPHLGTVGKPNTGRSLVKTPTRLPFVAV